MLRLLFLPLILARFFIAFIVVYVLQGCVPAAIGEMVQRKSGNDNPLVVCQNGVQGYLHITMKTEVTGQDNERVEIYCK